MTSPSTRLQLHASHTTLDLGLDTPVTLPVGAAGIANACFRHDPPTPLELERAIDAVEDALMQTRLSPAEGGTLVTSSAILRALPGLERDGSSLTRDAIEALFQRLASASLGQPGALAGMPAGTESAAALLILRECMHHLGYDTICIELPPPDPW